MKKIVVKVGTSTLTEGTQKLSKRCMLNLAQQVVQMAAAGKEVIIISSGAVATGRDLLCGDTASKQTFASIGQIKLMQVWSDLFSMFEKHVGQVLLSKGDFDSDQRQNTRDTLECLLKNQVIPIINESDALANNDTLAVLVAELMEADTLILLTDQEGLYTADPRVDPEAKLIPWVRCDEEVGFAGGSTSSLGTGGMASKVAAAQRAAKLGLQAIIASSFRPNVLIDLIEGQRIGTRFFEEG